MTPTSGANRSTNSTRSPRSLSEVTIVLDAGHDHKDSGAVVHGVKEVDFTRKQTAAIKKELESRGYKVVIASDRSVDKNGDGSVSNEERALFANKFSNSLFISIHADSGNRNGTYLYYPTEVQSSVNDNSKFWAENLSEALECGLLTEKSTGNGANGGLTKSKNLKAGSAIFHVEVLNLKNDTDRKNAQSQEFINNFAKRFVDGLVSVGGSANLPNIPRADVQKGVSNTTSPSPQNSSAPSTTTSQVNQDFLNDARFDRIASGDSSAMLKRGSRDPSVVKIKEMINVWLKQKNASAELLDTTGEGADLFDANLDRLIRKFQDDHGISRKLTLHNHGGLQVDGVVGPWTLMALRLNAGYQIQPSNLSSFLAGCDKVWQGGVWVNAETGMPPADYKSRLESLRRWGYENEQYNSVQLTDEEIKLNAPPQGVFDAVQDTLATYDNYRYGHDGSGLIDCSGFASKYMQRLGYKIPRLNTNSIKTLGKADGFLNIPLSQLGKPGSPIAALRVGDMVNFPWNDNGKMGHVVIVHHLDEKGNPVFMESTTSADDVDGKDGVQVGRSLESMIAAGRRKGFSVSELQVIRPLQYRGEKIQNIGLQGDQIQFPSQELPKGSTAATATFYFPPESSADYKMQGTGTDHKGRTIGTVEGFIAGRDKYISIAMDDVLAEQYDMRRISIPEVEKYYREKFNLPETFQFDFRIADTGSHFTGGKLGMSAMDICVESRAIAYGLGKRPVSWSFIMDNRSPGQNPEKPTGNSWRLNPSELDKIKRQNLQITQRLGN